MSAKKTKDTNMVDAPDVLVAGAIKLISGKALTMATGVVGSLLALNIWFASRFIENQDQIQTSVQELKISAAVTSSRLDQIETLLRESRK